MGRDNAHGGAAVGWTRTGGWGMSRARTWALASASCKKKTAQGLETLRGGVENDGGSRRNRTTDTRIFSPLLYLLS